ncbi:MAG: glycosyltransferase family 4 protein [Ilyomonas sp.]
MKKILFYSDCFVYSGSEHVLENLIKSPDIYEQYEMMFAYAYSPQYKKQVKKIYPVNRTVDLKSLKILSALNNWGYKYKLTNQKTFRYYYYGFRFFVSYFFEVTGIHNLYNLVLLLHLFRKKKPDILFINNGGYPGARSCRIAVIAAKLTGIDKIVFVVNNLAMTQKNFLEKQLDKFIGEKVSYFITASEAARKRLIQFRHFNPQKCIAIPNTLSTTKEQHAYSLKKMLREEFEIDNDTVILGSVGLLTARKGFNVLIEAIRRLDNSIVQNTPFKLLIFGDGEDKPKLQKQITESGLEKKVVLAGYRDDILSYMNSFDIFILPSIGFEDFPYVIIEAMLLKKPVIGTNVAGIPEQIQDEYNGYVVEPNNAQELTQAIAKLVADRAMQTTMGLNGYSLYNERFRNSIIIHKYLNIFSSLVETGFTCNE